MIKMHVKSGDTVKVLSGKDKGKKGKVLSVDKTNNKVVVEGVSMAQKHSKPKKAGDNGGIISKETPMYACKVMRVCKKCGQAARFGVKVLEDGSREKYCKKCNETID